MCFAHSDLVGCCRYPFCDLLVIVKRLGMLAALCVATFTTAVHGQDDAEIQEVFCRSVWDADEESGKLLVKVLQLRLDGVPEIVIRVNTEQVGLLDARMREIIRIAYHEMKLSTARKWVKMCAGWANFHEGD